jgi:hypothetical protein
LGVSIEYEVWSIEGKDKNYPLYTLYTIPYTFIMVSKRFLFTILSFVIIALAAAGAIFLAKGYRLSPKEGTIAGTGILSITSVPDQASVYLDGHLTTATNANINSLNPRAYDVKIIKEGYIPWEKKVEVKEGLVSDVKATLYRAIPTVYPLTYTGAQNPTLSPDGEKVVYIVPSPSDTSSTSYKKSGLWVWTMSDKSIAFARGAEPHQIGLPGVDYTKAKMKWSPDSSQVLLSFDNQDLLFDATRLNDPPRDVTATIDATLRSWADDQKTKDQARLELITDSQIRKTASASAILKWSPDETKILLGDNQNNYQVIDLAPNKGLTKEVKTYNLPPSPKTYSWLPDSEHLFFVEGNFSASVQPSASPKPVASQAASASPSAEDQTFAKLSVLEYDGANKSELYAGTFNPDSVFVWPDGSRLVVVSTFPTSTANLPNLFGINLK